MVDDFKNSTAPFDGKDIPSHGTPVDNSMLIIGAVLVSFVMVYLATKHGHKCIKNQMRDVERDEDRHAAIQVVHPRDLEEATHTAPPPSTVGTTTLATTDSPAAPMQDRIDAERRAARIDAAGASIPNGRP